MEAFGPLTDDARVGHAGALALTYEYLGPIYFDLDTGRTLARVTLLIHRHDII